MGMGMVGGDGGWGGGVGVRGRGTVCNSTSVMSWWCRVSR